MKWHRIYALILRYSYLLRRNFDRIADTFYWPLVDLLLWGLTGLYVDELTGNTFIIKAVIGGLVFWYIIYRVQGEVTVNLLEEFWNDNLINIFGSPLTFWEWVVAVMLNGLLKGLLSFIFAAVIAFLLYSVSVFNYGLYIIPFMFLLLLTGWSVGFFIAGLIFRYGTKIQTLAWTLVYLISPFSAVFYPVDILPLWAQKVAMFLPTTYVFEGLREVINTGHFSTEKFFTSLILSVIYLVVSIVFIRKAFSEALNKGLLSIY